MTLGKRYIAVGCDDAGAVHWIDQYIRNSIDEAKTAHVRSSYFLLVDLDALPRTDFTAEQLAMHAENRALYWADEFARLAPCLGGHPARKASELEPYITYHQWPIVPRGGQHVGMSTGVLAVHVPTGIAAISEDERSQYKNRQAALEKLRGLVAHKLREQAAEVRR